MTLHGGAKILLLAAVVWLAAPPVASPAGDAILVGDFDGAAPIEPAEGFAPEGWKPLAFPKVKTHTKYGIAENDGDPCLRAESRSGASAVYRELDFDLADYPVLAWRWKIDGVLEKGDATTKAGDDFAARVYVTFTYDPSRVSFFERVLYKLIKAIYGVDPPGEAVVYVWANKLKKGLSVANPYTDKAGVFVIESGPGLAGSWMSEKRNVLDDYRTFFGGTPTRIRGVAVMTDTDNTGEEAGACYDDISFLKAGP